MTKQERCVIYTMALKIYTEESLLYNYGLCGAIYHALRALDKRYIFPDPYHDMELYPEIYKHKAYMASSAYWFPRDYEGMNKRKAILKQAIAETTE